MYDILEEQSVDDTDGIYIADCGETIQVTLDATAAGASGKCLNLRDRVGLLDCTDERTRYRGADSATFIAWSQVEIGTAGVGATKGCRMRAVLNGTADQSSGGGTPNTTHYVIWGDDASVETSGQRASAVINRLVTEGIESGVITELSGYASIRPEVRCGMEKSRIDLLLQSDGRRPDCYVEIKNVTTCDDDGAGFFRDAVSVRASRHLRELTEMVHQGQRAVLFFCVQRGDVQQVRPADEIDPHYGEALRAALTAGVEAMAWRARVTPAEIVLERALPVVCP